MSTPKPHRRLSITRPTASEGAAAEAEPAGLEARVADLERRCAELESVVAHLLERLESRPEREGGSEPGEGEGSHAARVIVRDTGGGLCAARAVDASPQAADLRISRGRGSLAPYDRSGRKAVAIYAEGPRGPVRIYDDGGDCLHSQ